jgi:hypothetical protein
MQKLENLEIKRLRILKYYQELTRHKIDYDECLKFMSYEFNMIIPCLIRIIKKYNETDFTDTKLEHFDIDLITIDAFANKLFKEARKERKNATQTTLF